MDDDHIGHVYSSFMCRLHMIRANNQEAASLPSLLLLERFLEEKRFKLSLEEARWFIRKRFLQEMPHCLANCAVFRTFKCTAMNPLTRSEKAIMPLTCIGFKLIERCFRCLFFRSPKCPQNNWETWNGIEPATDRHCFRPKEEGSS
jgi:hypothetical protein